MRKTSPRGLVRTLFDMPIYGSNSVPYSYCNNTYSVGTADPSALHSISWWHAENCTVHIYSWSELYSTLCSQTEGKNGEALGFMARLLYRHYIYVAHTWWCNHSRKLGGIWAINASFSDFIWIACMSWSVRQPARDNNSWLTLLFSLMPRNTYTCRVRKSKSYVNFIFSKHPTSPCATNWSR